jgi:hypothetical protein
VPAVLAAQKRETVGERLQEDGRGLIDVRLASGRLTIRVDALAPASPRDSIHSSLWGSDARRIGKPSSASMAIGIRLTSRQIGVCSLK